jgi:alpha-D-ribose 1-methylphosphonate 5-phosphate C-P lyase
MSEYNFAFLDEQSKRMIRRAILKAVAIPGYQVPFGSREMPLSYGWGTGGVQVPKTALGSVMVTLPAKVDAEVTRSTSFTGYSSTFRRAGFKVAGRRTASQGKRPDGRVTVVRTVSRCAAHRAGL